MPSPVAMIFAAVAAEERAARKAMKALPVVEPVKAPKVKAPKVAALSTSMTLFCDANEGRVMAPSLGTSFQQGAWTRTAKALARRGLVSLAGSVATLTEAGLAVLAVSCPF